MTARANSIVASVGGLAARGKSMSDKPGDKKPDDKTLEAIKRHKPTMTFEMKGPDGSKIRQDRANELVEKDKTQADRNRAEKYAKFEKEKIATTKDMEQGTKGRLSKEFNKQNAKEM